MQKIGFAALAVALMCGSANAADLGGGLKDDAVENAYTGKAPFVGIGIGIQAGGQFTNIDIADKFDGIGADGLVGGLHLEYLVGIGKLRAGAYVEGGLSNVNVSITDYSGSDHDALIQDYYYGGGVKGGFILGSSTLVYGRLGYERAGWSTDFDDSVEITVDSLVLGGGIETMVNGNLSIGLGVDYLVPMNIEAEGHDITDLFEESEGLRVMARATWRR